MPVICDYVSDRICDHIFCQKCVNPIFSAYNGIFKIAYAEIMPHMQTSAYMPHISIYAVTFFSIFFIQHSFKTVKYFRLQTIIGIYH